MKMIGWRAWFEDMTDPYFRIYTSKPGVRHQIQCEWEDVPLDGCYGMQVYFDETNAQGLPLMRSCQDTMYFMFKAPDGNMTIGHNEDPPEVTAERYNIPISWVKRGKWSSDQTMQNVLESMRQNREY